MIANTVVTFPLTAHPAPLPCYYTGHDRPLQDHIAVQHRRPPVLHLSPLFALPRLHLPVQYDTVDEFHRNEDLEHYCLTTYPLLNGTLPQEISVVLDIETRLLPETQLRRLSSVHDLSCQSVFSEYDCVRWNDSVCMRCGEYVVLRRRNCRV